MQQHKPTSLLGPWIYHPRARGLPHHPSPVLQQSPLPLGGPCSQAAVGDLLPEVPTNGETRACASSNPSSISHLAGCAGQAQRYGDGDVGSSAPLSPPHQLLGGKALSKAFFIPDLIHLGRLNSRAPEDSEQRCSPETPVRQWSRHSTSHSPPPPALRWKTSPTDTAEWSC